jgi:hypothetical protein
VRPAEGDRHGAGVVAAAGELAPKIERDRDQVQAGERQQKDEQHEERPGDGTEVLAVGERDREEQHREGLEHEERDRPVAAPDHGRKRQDQGE